MTLIDDTPLIRSVLAGVLTRPTVDRKIFLVDGKPWRYMGVTAFMLMELFRQGKDIGPFVRFYLNLGFNVFRVMVNKPEVPGQYPGWGTPTLSVALDFIDYMVQQGARVELTLFGSQVDASFVSAWIEALETMKPSVFVEGINEPGHAGQWPDTSYVDSLVLPYRRTLPYANGDYTYDASKARGSYGTVHPDRDDPCNTARKAKAVVDMWDIAKIAWVGDEPAKPQDIAYRTDCFLAMFGIFGLFGAGGTFHTLGGQFGQLPDAQEQTCAEAAIAGLTAFPASTPNDYGYSHGQAELADEAASGSLRTYRAGPYGVRVCPSNAGYPILIGV